MQSQMIASVQCITRDQIRARLTAAFKTLRSMHIAARTNYQCCQGCGGAAIDDKYGTTHVGYVFWHNQDHARMMNGGNLYLAYGTLVKDAKGKDLGDDKYSTLVGHLIVTVLQQHGVPVRWNGSNSTRICVVFDANEKE